jgi:voltage-gated sodium channel
VQNVLTIGFMIEISFRLYSYKSRFFLDIWNVFDLLLVLFSMTSTWLLSFFAPYASTNLYVLSSTMRLIRIMTVGRLIRVMIVFKELWIVISGFVEAIKTLFWLSILLVFILYIGAVFVTIEVGQNSEVYDPYIYVSGGWDYKEYFGTVGRSMFTLFQIVTLDNWSNGIARHVMSNQPAMFLFFILFIIFTSFGVMNVVVGIIVERTLATAKQNQQRFQRTQERERTRVLNHLKEIFEYADKDGNGSLTVDEFRTAIRQPEVERKLKLIELPVADAEELFTILDHDGSGELSVDEFIGGCIRLKGNAKSKDLLAVQVNIQAMAQRLETLELQFDQCVDKVNQLQNLTESMVKEAENVFE